MEKFIEVAVLCKCDFSEKLMGMGPVKSIEKIQELGTSHCDVWPELSSHVRVGTVEKVVRYLREHPWESLRYKYKTKADKESIAHLSAEQLADMVVPSEFNAEGARRVFYRFLYMKTPQLTSHPSRPETTSEETSSTF